MQVANAGGIGDLGLLNLSKYCNRDAKQSTKDAMTAQKITSTERGWDLSHFLDGYAAMQAWIGRRTYLHNLGNSTEQITLHR